MADAPEERGFRHPDAVSQLKAAAKAGVKNYFVEQDQAPGDPVASLRQSFEYVNKLKY